MKLKIMKVLVTGCAGFIGSHLSEKLLKEGFEVTGIDNFDPFYDKRIKEANLTELSQSAAFRFYLADITKYEQIKSIKDDFDAVIHLAAKAGVRPSILNPEAYLDNNIRGTLNLLNYMQSRGVKNIIFASSSSVYGDNAISPYREDSITDFPISPYAFTKKSCELLLYNYHHLYKLNSISLRLFTVYGPKQRPDLAIHKFFNAILNESPIVVYGDGNTSRDYTYIDDTVDGIIKAFEYLLHGKVQYDIFNLGNNAPTKLSDLVSNIETVTGKKANIIREGMQHGDVSHTCADITKAQTILSYNPQIKLQEGLEKFFKWKQKHFFTKA